MTTSLESVDFRLTLSHLTFDKQNLFFEFTPVLETSVSSKVSIGTYNGPTRKHMRSVRIGNLHRCRSLHRIVTEFFET